MEEWKECKLGEIAHFTTGKLNSNAAEDNGLYPFFTCSPETYRINSYAFDTNAILLAGNNAEGNFNIKRYSGKFNAYQRTYVITVDDNTDLNFLFYALKLCLADFKHISQGTATKFLTAQILNNFVIRLPPLPTQQKIAAILSSLDDKIELNNKINTNLEQQAQALFKNWFVDFEPFGGKMPEGWKEADIYSIANIIYGSPFASKLFNTEKNGKPIIRIRDLKDQHSDVYTPEERDDAYLIQPKDIVVGMDGEFRPYIWGSEPGWLNQRVCVFENKRPKGKAFLFFSIKPLLDVVEKTQVATTVIHIGKKDFDKFQITLPTEDILDKFDELTDPILDQIVANRLENRRLAELRDTLLPKLMNGEIEVNEVRI